MALQLRNLFPLVCSALFSICLAGCLSIVNGKPPGPWHTVYETIESSESQSFISNALVRAVAEFGEPGIPVNKVLLRRSRKTGDARRYRIGEDFSLTECVDTTNGVFVIYLAVDPDHRNYYALLGHECLHLIHPRITDWYMEGIATLFSEQLCADLEIQWGDWKRHFMRTRREPYGISYQLMKELQSALPEEYPLLVRYTATNGKGPQWLRVDIDAWLNALQPEKHDIALKIISAYADALQKKASTQYYFTVPEALK